MDWNDLRFLLAVSQQGSLARAASELGVTKATVSRRIAALETSLGAPLVLREPTGMRLTDAGKAVAVAAKSVEETLRALQHDPSLRQHEDVAGIVKLTCPPWIAERLLIPALGTLRSQYPSLELVVFGTHEVVDLSRRTADLALRNVVPSVGPLVCRRIGELAGCIYGSELYQTRRGVPANREELLKHDLVGYEGMRGMPGFEWMLDAPWGERIVFRAGDPVGVSAAVRAGLGLGAIPCLIGETESGLRRVDALGVGFSPLYLVGHEDSREVARIKVVSQFVVELLRANADVLLGRGASVPE